MIFRAPLSAGIAAISVIFRAGITPLFIQIGNVDKSVAVGILFATFTERKIFPAGFTVDIPVPVHRIIIFIVEEVFIAIGTLFQVFLPAFRAKVNGFMVNRDWNQVFRFPAEAACVVHPDISIG